MTEEAAGKATAAAPERRGFSMRFGTLVTALSVVVIATGLGIAGSSLWVSNDFKDTSQDSATLMVAMRNQVTADMYHDTLRGVVFRAMYAAINYDTTMVKSAKAELDEYSASFRAVIEVVLHGRQYRPFLQMSVQGATIVMGFWIINIVYVWYSGSELSDYAGAGITLGLVVAGFLPPLLELRSKVSRAVSEEMASLRLRLDRLITRAAPSAAAPAATARELEERLDEALVMLRISYLEKLHAQLGQSEAMDIVVKLLVPLTTVAWYGYKYYKGMP